jgi:hypothetical protein
VDGLSANDLERYLRAVGDELASSGAPARLIVVGGAALVLRGDVARFTGDVDVLALVEGGVFLMPDPLPPELQRAIQNVAEGYGLDRGWVNTSVVADWRHRWPEGLPPGLEEAEWRVFSSLEVGLAGRSTLIPLKVHAVLDRGTHPVFDEEGRVVGGTVALSGYDERHLTDLVALAPNDTELEAAAAWVREQDTGDVAVLVQAILDRVRAACR